MFSARAVRPRAARDGRSRAIRGAARCAIEQLERRALLSGGATIQTSESEPNNTFAAANLVTVSATPTAVNANLSSASDIDYFKFTLSARSGVFLDVDSFETGLSSTLDSVIELYNSAESRIDSNDDGRDFETLALNETSNTLVLFKDSALYVDLTPGTYVVKMAGKEGSGAYQLKFTADALYTSSVPVFSSLPDSADTIYLDFDGHAGTDAWNSGNPYSIAPFDLNGTPLEFTPAERLAIYHTWHVVADAFAPFNINVTTNYGGPYADGIAHRQVIGNSNGAEVGHASALGVAWVNGYNSGGPTRKTGFTFADNFLDFPNAGISGKIVANAIEMGNTSAHEVAHTMGLNHYTATSQRGSFLFVDDFGLNRERWSFGTNANGIAQDDLATIASPTNTFGYRSDDHGNTRPAASVLTPSASTYAASGVIHNTSDFDYFRFRGSGDTTITLDIPEHLGHLDAELYLYNSAGTQIGSSDLATQLGGSIAMSLLAPGDYYVAVRSDGGYGELGMYDLRIDTTPPPTGTIAGRVFRDVTLNHAYETAAGDTFLGGVTLYLDANNDDILNDGEVTTTSSLLDGSFSFTDLANGTHYVKAVPPTGYVTNIEYDLLISGGESHNDINFGNFPIVYHGSPGDDSYIVRLNAAAPATLEIVESFSGLTYAAPRAIVSSLTINGGAGDDTLDVDAQPAGPLLFNGGTHAGTIDTLNVNGGGGGTYTFDADAKLGTARLIVNVTSSDAAVVFNASQHIESLNLAAAGAFAQVAAHGSRMLVTHTLSIVDGATLDLVDNDMIVHQGVVGQPVGPFTYDGITGLIGAAYDFGAWDLPGLTTSAAQQRGDSLTTLGVSTYADIFGIGPDDLEVWQGETVTGRSVLVKYTWVGDIDLNGYVDAVDYGTIDQWIQFPGSYGYAKGDINFDGVIDAVDYGLIDYGIQLQGLPL